MQRVLIETDPEENENLADKNQDLVLELLAEAENAVKDAPPQLVSEYITSLV